METKSIYQQSRYLNQERTLDKVLPRYMWSLAVQINSGHQVSNKWVWKARLKITWLLPLHPCAVFLTQGKLISFHAAAWTACDFRTVVPVCAKHRGMFAHDLTQDELIYCHSTPVMCCVGDLASGLWHLCTHYLYIGCILLAMCDVRLNIFHQYRIEAWCNSRCGWKAKACRQTGRIIHEPLETWKKETLQVRPQNSLLLRQKRNMSVHLTPLQVQCLWQLSLCNKITD